MNNPYQIVKDFESALCDYTGAKYAVTTTSCTMALLLACRYFFANVGPWTTDIFPAEGVPGITIPKHTYVGVPMSIIHAGFLVEFDDMIWEGSYQLRPLPVADSARWLTYGLYRDEIGSGAFVCVSFHPTKHLGISTHGGAILHDNDEADEWFRMARFDGRKEGVAPRSQKDWVLAYHCYMNPVTAAEGLVRLSTLPKHNEPLPNDDYADLSKLEIFK
jgi:dTDP-4-amino-4,6-dideoxygalactose transaminase